jgi:hypothetical protein
VTKVESSVIINSKAGKIFDSFIEQNELKSWWGVERSLVEKKQGGVYSLAWGITEKGFQYISTGIITVFKPPHHLLVDHFIYFNPEKQILGPTYLDIRINETNEGSRLVLVQGGYQTGGDWNWFHEAVKQAWPVALESLKKHLEG